MNPSKINVVGGIRSQFAFAAFLLAALLTAGAQNSKHAQVELLSRETAAVPGKELILGVHIKLEPGWHIYWLNPGDSGQPPSFSWQLPAGWNVGEIRWPRPERMQSSPTLADYGYHDDVLLMVPVKVPAGQTAPKTEDIRVDAKWLVCREVCIPEKTQLALKIPIAKTAGSSAAAPSFVTTQRQVPKPAPASWKISAQSRKDEFLLTVGMGVSVRNAQFFPLDEGQIDNAAQQRVERTIRGFRLTLKKSDLLTKPVRTLRGILVIQGRGAWELNAPVLSKTALK
ncbi:MAG TPA: protein-disulfide reductase DsbD domain-containing protein [Candidatus Angelobacter sp.]|nr:protein-disulfide reductase DsbD domain-containing protein [Candidatus Angelobacter sp.]